MMERVVDEHGSSDSRKHRSRWSVLRTGLAGTLLALGGAIGGLVLSEVAFRLVQRFTCVENGPSYFETRPWGWTHRAGAVVFLHGCVGHSFEWRSSVQINSHGLRDREVAYEKPRDVERVFLLGDSITEAVQVPLDHTFAKLVEADLRGQGLDAEVVNGGHAGFSTDNELVFYQQEARRYSSALVLLVFNLQNDVLENSPALYQRLYEHAGTRFPPKPSFELGEYGSLRTTDPMPLDDPGRTDISRWLWDGIAARFYLLRAIERRIATPPPAKLPYPLTYDEYAPPDETWTDAWALTRRLLRELRASVERDGSRFAVVLVPGKELVSPAAFERSLGFFGISGGSYDLDRPHRMMTTLLDAERVTYLDLLPILRAHFAATGATGFFDWDIHLNEQGHAAIAPSIAEFVRRQLAG